MTAGVAEVSVTKPRIVTCPGCKGPSVYGPENEYRPFCSLRCKNNDFGAWASENYRVPTPPPASDEDESGQPYPPAH